MILANEKTIREIDEIAVKHGILPIQLMENAGGNAAKVINTHIPANSNILVVCGKGHNGGDGYVVARHLSSMNHKVSIFVTSIPEDKNDPTFINYNICRQTNIKFVKTPSDKYDIIIDAMLGVGIKLPLRDNIRRIVNKLNKINAIKIAIDIPTGIDANTGEADNDTFQADYSVTMEIPKAGMYITPAKKFCGDIYISSIGIQKYVYGDITSNLFLIDELFVKETLPIRDDYSHKGGFGKIMAIGGSPNYSGAITFSAHSAVKSGAGLVYVAIPDSILKTVSGNIADAIKIPLKCNNDGTISDENDDFIDDLDKYDAVLVGPGIGTNPKTLQFVKKVCENTSVPLVMDADALKILPFLKRKERKNIIITPHPGEAAALLQIKPTEMNAHRMYYTNELTKKFGVNTLLKGNGTIISNGEQLFINTTGNSTLSRGGSGDILSGMILAFMGMGLDIIKSASIAAYIHGKAGELAGNATRGYSVSMNDLLNHIPKAFQCIFS